MRVALVVVAVFWLLPVLGLLVASLRPESATPAAAGGRCSPHRPQLTLANYGALLADRAVLGSLWNTVLIAVPATVLVVVVRRRWRRTRWPGSSSRGRDWVMIGVVGLLVVPVQVALIPVARLLGAVGLYGSIPGVVLFHVAFGLPFAIFLLRNFFAGIPRDLLEAARMDGGEELRIFWRLVLPIAAAGDRLAGHLPVPLGVERPAGRAGVRRRGLGADHRGAAQPAAAVRQPTSTCWPAARSCRCSCRCVVFFSFQRYFVQGVLAGSTK